MDILLDTLQYGIPYAILALGVFISYRVLDFADLSCEGTFVFGAAISLVMIANGLNPWFATLCAILGGCFAGFITGILHTKLKVNGLLSGIITMTALFSINMVIFGIAKGEKFSLTQTYNSFRTLKITASGDPTIFSLFGSLFDIRKYGLIIELVLILIVVVGLLYAFFGTEVGMSMRSCGMNQKMARAQGISTTFYIVFGLMLSNALIALSGALQAQRDYTCSTTSGTGMIVVGLASIIIGEALFGKRSFMNWLISVSLGAIVYYFIIAVVLFLGFPNHLLKLLYAVLIVVILAFGFVKEKYHFSPGKLFKTKILHLLKKDKSTDNELNVNEDMVIGASSNVLKNNEDYTPLDVPMLEANGLLKVFNRSGNATDVKIALNDLSVTINEGDFVTIIGGNGSGKSTFFNTVSGVYTPEAGTIKIKGKDVTKMTEYKRSYFIGKVAQDPYQGTAHDMSILENMSIAMRRNRRKTLKWGFNKKDNALFKEKLSMLGLGLENRMSSKIGTLSGGQRQAVTLLMATLQRPDVLFLDEHTAALDPKTAKTVLELTDSIVKENHLTAVMVTHNMKDAIKYGNRLLMFNNGKIIYDVKGEEKQNLTVEELLRKFEDKVEFSDKDILG
ncbi:MAG: ATP-binding cassette domain-containing protein [Anaeroplasmataceae bacterium]